MNNVTGPIHDKKWTAARIDNAHDRVRAALEQFGARVITGELMWIGAVYDFELAQRP